MYYEKNRTRILLQKKEEYYPDHLEERREAGRQRYAANREAIKAASRRRYAAKKQAKLLSQESLRRTRQGFDEPRDRMPRRSADVAKKK